MMRFRGKADSLPRLPAASAKRQGRITTYALLLLGKKEAAIAFLNEPDMELDARPIDIATQSDEGFARVEQLIQRLVKARRRST